MSDDEDGFGVDISDDDDAFGTIDDEDEDDEDGGFGDLDEDDEDDEDDAGFGIDDDDDDEEAPAIVATPKLPPQKKQQAGVIFAEFAKKFFKNGNNAVYSIDPIKKPLLGLQDSAATVAVKIYRLVMQFMGVTAKVGQSKLKAIQAVQHIIRPALQHNQIKDEIYCQIMKLWTKNPAPNSRARGTILLSLCLGCFVPSDKLLPVVRQFILEGPKGFVNYCNLLLRRTIHNGQRMEPPCQLELAAVKKKQILRIKVTVDLVTGTTASARLDPASTAAEWTDEICRSVGIKDSYGWTVYMDRFGQLVSLRGDGKSGEKIMDAISKIDQAHQQQGEKSFLMVAGQFSLRKELFKQKEDYSKDSLAAHKIMHQIQHGIKAGKFKPNSDQEINSLAAMMYYSLYDDDFDDKRLKEFLPQWFPEAVFSGKGRTVSDRLREIEKITARSNYSRNHMTTAQTENLVINYAISTWGQIDSFSADKPVRLLASR